MQQHAALLDVIELLWRNDADVSDPGSIRRLVWGGLSNGRHREKRPHIGRGIFSSETSTCRPLCSLLCAVAAPTVERPSVIEIRTKSGKGSGDWILAECYPETIPLPE